jgi:hypothetical protein
VDSPFRLRLGSRPEANWLKAFVYYGQGDLEVESEILSEAPTQESKGTRR